MLKKINVFSVFSIFILILILINFSGCSGDSYIYIVGLTNDGAGTGSISSESTITGMYPADTAITVQATPDSGYVFSGWLDAETGGELVSSENPFNFLLSSDTYLYARFGLPPGAPDPDVTAPALTVDNITSGSIHTGFIVGTASDNTAVSRVEVQLDGGSWNTATGTESWKFALPTGDPAWNAGTEHEIALRCEDPSGNLSDEVDFNVQIGHNMDINGDGYIDIAVSATAYNNNTGRVFIFYSAFTSQTAGSADALITGEKTGGQLGISVIMEDLNTDGYGDIVVSSTTEIDSPSVYIFYGGPDFTGGAASDADAVITGNDGMFLGHRLAVGDINGDGYVDLIISEPLYATDTGRVLIFMGDASGITDRDLAAGDNADAVITGVVGTNVLGMMGIVCGDVNGDGYQDIIASNYTNTYIFHGGASGLSDMPASAAETIISNTTFLQASCDINSDGYSDLLISGGTVIYGLFGGSGGISNAELTVSGGDFEITGLSSSNFVDTGDVNGDGYIDIAVGAVGENRALIFEGGAAGFTNRNIADANTTVIGESGDKLGSDILLKDLNGDGYAEMIMGAYFHNSNQGCIYIQSGAFGGIIGRDYSTDTPGASITGNGDYFGIVFGK